MEIAEITLKDIYTFRNEAYKWMSNAQKSNSTDLPYHKMMLEHYTAETNRLLEATSYVLSKYNIDMENIKGDILYKSGEVHIAIRTLKVSMALDETIGDQSVLLDKLNTIFEELTCHCILLPIPAHLEEPAAAIAKM